MTVTVSRQDLSAHADAIKSQGYTVLPSVLTAEQIERAKSSLLKLFESERQCGAKENWSNPQYQISLCLPAKDKTFLEFCFIPDVLELSRMLVGRDCVVSSMNGFTTRPHGERQSLHVDVPGETEMITSVQMILCLDEFTHQNGCTRVVPYSQKMAGSTQNFEREESLVVEIEAPAGSVIAYDSDLIHGAGSNETSNLRLCLHLTYCRSWVKPQWDFVFSLQKGLRDRLTPEERAILGIDAHPYVYEPCTGRPFEMEKPGRLAYYIKRLRSKIFSGL